MSRLSDPTIAAFGTDVETPQGRLTPRVFSPTRRRLLNLMAVLPAATLPMTAEANASQQRTQPTSNLIPRLFAEVRAHLAEHEHALQGCDRLEAALVAEFGYPRVRLPDSGGRPDRYAAEPKTIAHHVPPGRRRDRLQQVLQQRQARWADAARACGLTQTQAREEALFRAVQAAADTLYAMPATTLTDILLKLVVLLSLEEPGETERDASPWRELRLILPDLDRLNEVRGTKP